MSQIVQLPLPAYPIAPELFTELARQITLLKLKIEALENKAFQVRQQSTVCFNIREGVRVVSQSDIVFCEAESNYTQVHLSDGSKLLLSISLKAVQDMLDQNDFIRVHHSYLVNRSKITLVSTSKHEMTLLDGHLIPISRSRLKHIKEQLQR